MLHPTELCGTLLGYAAPWPYWLHCTFVSYATPSLDTLHHTKLCFTLYWATLHPFDLRYTPFWATLHPSKLLCTLLSYTALFKLICTLLNYAVPFLAMLHPSELRCTLLSCSWYVRRQDFYWNKACIGRTCRNRPKNIKRFLCFRPYITLYFLGFLMHTCMYKTIFLALSPTALKFF
jgi:hypothetical protein